MGTGDHGVLVAQVFLVGGRETGLERFPFIPFSTGLLKREIFFFNQEGEVSFLGFVFD